MAKTANAKKAHRGSQRKREHNLLWKRRIKVTQKAEPLTAESYKTLQSVVDKATNNKVIHKNKAARIKARLAKELAKTHTK